MNGQMRILCGAVALILCSAGVAADGKKADDQRSRLSPLSPAMNGEYRCSNGKTFGVEIRGSVIVGGDLRPAPTREGLPVGANATVPMQMEHKVEAFDYHGATVRWQGEDHKLMLQDGAPTVLKEDGGLRWELSDAAAPFTGRLTDRKTELGTGCVLVKPAPGKN